MLHVTNGHTTLHLIERAGIPGRTMVWCDPLDEGPVRGRISDEALLRDRAQFLASPPATVNDVAAQLAGWRAAVNDTSSYDELVLWFEHDLFDQLNLIQLLDHLGRRTPLQKPVSLICIDRYPGHPNFKGLGELTPGDMATLFPSRTLVTDEHLAVSTRAWTAFRSADPRDIEAFLQSNTSPLPFLAEALRRHLEEFPDAATGLSRSERRLMEQALSGPADLHAVLPRMHDGERWYYVTDTVLMNRARSLASCAPPLLMLMSDTTQPSPSGTIALTPEGRNVLSGRADRIPLCGVDRWLGGVHVTGRGPVWRWTGTGVRWQE